MSALFWAGSHQKPLKSGQINRYTVAGRWPNTRVEAMPCHVHFHLTLAASAQLTEVGEPGVYALGQCCAQITNAGG
jgi:hypothetical protein